MNRKLIGKLIGVTAALLLGASTLAAAHDGWDGERGWQGHGHGDGDGDYGRGQYQQHYRGDHERYYEAPRYEAPRYEAPRYAPPRYVQPQYGYERHWQRGERLPYGYYAPGYGVSDYGRYGAYAPPRGCRWLRVDNDLLLTAITSGVVLDVLYNLHH